MREEDCAFRGLVIRETVIDRCALHKKTTRFSRPRMWGLQQCSALRTEYVKDTRAVPSRHQEQDVLCNAITVGCCSGPLYYGARLHRGSAPKLQWVRSCTRGRRSILYTCPCPCPVSAPSTPGPWPYEYTTPTRETNSAIGKSSGQISAFLAGKRTACDCTAPALVPCSLTIQGEDGLTARTKSPK